MSRQTVYDLPTRLFHLTFVATFIGAFTIGKTFDNESMYFVFHIILGLTMGFLVVWRILWGIIGTHHARFANFVLNPKDLVDYFRDVLTGAKSKVWAGHNPASSWAAIIMLSLGLGLAITGFLMTTGYKEEVEDLHEFLASGFLLTSVAHVLGLIFHTLRNRDALPLSMIDGKKDGVPRELSIENTRGRWAVLLLILTVGVVFSLGKNYDSKKGTIKFLGSSLQVVHKETNQEVEKLSGEQEDSDSEDAKHDNE